MTGTLRFTRQNGEKGLEGRIWSEYLHVNAPFYAAAYRPDGPSKPFLPILRVNAAFLSSITPCSSIIAPPKQGIAKRQNRSDYGPMHGRRRSRSEPQRVQQPNGPDSRRTCPRGWTGLMADCRPGWPCRREFYSDDAVYRGRSGTHLATRLAFCRAHAARSPGLAITSPSR